MRFDLITLFPAMIAGPVSESILKRAQEAGLIEIKVHNLRDWAPGRHLACDDAPFGGGDGMVMTPGPITNAVRAVKAQAPGSAAILLSPQGERLDQNLVRELSLLPGLILVCGHYAGVDERARVLVIEREISIGDYVLSGGELASLVLMDAVARQLPGVLGNERSARDDSFPARLEAPQYTRPAEFEGLSVPAVLLSGHHGRIETWRKKQGLLRTWQRRPDLLERYPPDPEEAEWLKQMRNGAFDAGGNDD
jgi:tRNA (guanine37-N1)-methyltransferase